MINANIRHAKIMKQFDGAAPRFSIFFHCDDTNPYPQSIAHHALYVGERSLMTPRCLRDRIVDFWCGRIHRRGDRDPIARERIEKRVAKSDEICKYFNEII